MRDRDAVRLKSTNLRGRLRFNLIRVEPSRESSHCESGKTIPKVLWTSPGNQAGEPAGINQRFPIHEHDMAADAPAGTSFGEFHSLVKGESIRHERSGGDDSTLVRLGDGTIDAVSKTEIVGIDDESAHAKSLAGDCDARGVRRCVLGVPGLTAWFGGLTVLSGVTYTHCSGVFARMPFIVERP